MNIAIRSAFCRAIGIVTLLALPGIARAQNGKTAQKQCGSLFGSKVCTSYRTSAGKVTEFSLRVPLAMVENAPAKVPMVWPPKADLIVRFAPIVQEQTGFRFANVYWEAHGHPPAPYMVPHFDFHFYFAPLQKVLAINCKNTAKPQTLPAGYTMRDVTMPQIGVLAGSCIPAMGMHSAPKSDFNPKIPWKGSLLVGYYNRKPLFIEPMLTRELLLRKQSFSLPVPGIEPAPHVRYPKRFRAVYMPKSKTYDFVFSY